MCYASWHRSGQFFLNILLSDFGAVKARCLDGTIYDTEAQQKNTGNLPKRSCWFFIGILYNGIFR
ncbi:MAG: hypothetical protein LIO96_00770 [Lachnospiraceae bacterium]|nr:hypothetical protein [Lachnospiraceae bacterium]